MLFLAVVKLFRVMLCLAVVVIFFSNDAVLRDAVSSCCFCFCFFCFVISVSSDAVSSCCG